jgi:hypothetical protein
MTGSGSVPERSAFHGCRAAYHRNFIEPPARHADLPDGGLALLEGELSQEVGHERITIASLEDVRGERPGIRFDTAQGQIAGSAAEPARLEDLSVG